MKNETYEQIKQNYEDIKRKYDELKKVFLEVKELKKDKKVKRYIELSEFLKFQKEPDYTDDRLKIMAFDNISLKMNKIRPNDTNMIYVCYGPHIKGQKYGEKDYIVDNIENADFIKYVNLEQRDDVKVVLIEDLKQFENGKIIIHVEPLLAENEYYRIRSEFAINLIDYGQEEAVKKIIKKYSKN